MNSQRRRGPRPHTVRYGDGMFTPRPTDGTKYGSRPWAPEDAPPPQPFPRDEGDRIVPFPLDLRYRAGHHPAWSHAAPPTLCPHGQPMEYRPQTALVWPASNDFYCQCCGGFVLRVQVPVGRHDLCGWCAFVDAWFLPTQVALRWGKTAETVRALCRAGKLVSRLVPGGGSREYWQISPLAVRLHKATAPTLAECEALYFEAETIRAAAWGTPDQARSEAQLHRAYAALRRHPAYVERGPGRDDG